MLLARALRASFCGMLSSLRAGSRACRGRRGFTSGRFSRGPGLEEECGRQLQVFRLKRKRFIAEIGRRVGTACYRKEGDQEKVQECSTANSSSSSGRGARSSSRLLSCYIDQFVQSSSSRYSPNGYHKQPPFDFRLHRRLHGSGSRSKPSSEPQSEVSSSEASSYGHSERAVVTALWCNFLVFALKCGVWIMTGSHVMLAEAVHSLADLANQGLLAYGLVSSKRAPDALHPYGYSKERFVWSLISAVGIFCLGSGATIVHGISNLGNAEPLDNMLSAAIVIGGSMFMEGGSLYVAVNAVRQGAAAEGMEFRDYIWRGHDPTSVAVMMEDGAAVTGLFIAALSLTAVHYTGKAFWDPLGSILVGNLLGMVAVFLIQRNRHALLGRSMDSKDVKRVLDLLAQDTVVDAVHDCKSEVIGPGSYRFKAEIDFDGQVVVHNYLQRIGRETWIKEFQEASKDPVALEKALANYGEEVVAALGSEVDRLEKNIQSIVPGVRHVDIEAHNPKGPLP